MRIKAIKTGFLRSFLPIIISILLGAVVLVAVYQIGTYNCQKDADKRMDSLVRYIEKQCSLYDDVAAEEQTKSLIRIADKAHEFQKTFDDHRATKDTSFIYEYMDDQRLTGIIVTDSEMNAIASCVVEGVESHDWKNVLVKTSSVMDNLDKCYTERVETSDGQCLDYAVMGRSDGRGIILCYHQQDRELVTGTQMSIKTLLSEYDFDVNGVIVVTDGVTVIGSNDASLNGKRADECDVIKDVRNVADFGSLIPVTANDVAYYAMRGKCKSNYVYVFYPEQRLFMQRSVLFAYTSVVYVILVMIGIALHMMLDYVRRRERERAQDKHRAEMDKLAKEAICANEAKTDFLRRISHDIRTPVNGICGMVDIAEDCDNDPALRHDCYEKIRQASGYLLELVSGVLDMSKLEQKTFFWSDEPFDIEKEFRNIVSLISVDTGERGITFRSEVGAVIHNRVVGSVVLFKRICSNLIGNALKYTSAGGTVSTSLREECFETDGQKIHFCFVCKDTGIGMSRDFQQHMYEPFAKEDTSANPSYNGVGLGLSIVKSLLDTMGGSIDIQSVQGVGTTATVHFVFTTDPDLDCEAVVPEAQQTPNGEADLKGCRILLAEDNDLNMEIAVYFIEKAGAKVVCVKNGKDAVAAYLDEPAGSFDLILMDLMMPVMDGIKATQVIRSSGRRDAGSIPIIAMTANVYADDVERAKRAGMNDHLAKPLDPRKMNSMIASYYNKEKSENKVLEREQ